MIKAIVGVLMIGAALLVILREYILIPGGEGTTISGSVLKFQNFNHILLSSLCYPIYSYDVSEGRVTNIRLFPKYSCDTSEGRIQKYRFCANE